MKGRNIFRNIQDGGRSVADIIDCVYDFSCQSKKRYRTRFDQVTIKILAMQEGKHIPPTLDVSDSANSAIVALMSSGPLQLKLTFPGRNK